MADMKAAVTENLAERPSLIPTDRTSNHALAVTKLCLLRTTAPRQNRPVTNLARVRSRLLSTQALQFAVGSVYLLLT